MIFAPIYKNGLIHTTGKPYSITIDAGGMGVMSTIQFNSESQLTKFLGKNIDQIGIDDFMTISDCYDVDESPKFENLYRLDDSDFDSMLEHLNLENETLIDFRRNMTEKIRSNLTFHGDDLTPTNAGSDLLIQLIELKIERDVFKEYIKLNSYDDILDVIKNKIESKRTIETKKKLKIK